MAILCLFAAAFFMDLAFSLVATALPWWATLQFHLAADTLGEMGLTGALYTIISLSAGYLPGWLAPRRRVLIASLGAAGAMLATGFSVNVTMLFGAAALQSLSLGLFWPALQAVLTELPGSMPLSKRVSGFNLSWSLGFMVGPLLGGHMYPLNHRLPFVVAAGAVVVVALLLLTARLVAARAAVMPTRVQPAVGNPEFPAALPEAGGAAGGENASASSAPGPFLLAAWCSNMVNYFAAASLRYFYPLLATAHHVGKPVQGDILMVLGVAQAATFAWMARRGGWQQRRQTYVVGLALAAGGLAATALAPGAPLQAVAFTSVGVGFGVIYSLSLYHSLHSGQGRRNAGIHEGIIGGSGILGAVSGGFVSRGFGNAASFWLCAAVVVTGAVATLWLLRPRGPRVGPASPGRNHRSDRGLEV